MKKWSIGIAIILVVISIGVFLSSLKALDDSQLLPQKFIAIKDEDNAFIDFNKAGEIFDTLNDADREKIYMIHDGKINVDATFVNKQWIKNTKALQRLQKGLKKQRYQYSHLPQFSDKTLEPKFGQVSTLNILKLLHAKILQQEGQEREALTEIFEVARFGQLFRQEKSILCYAVGSSAINSAFSSLNTFLDTTSLPANTLVPYIKTVEQFKTDGTELSETFKTMYLNDKTTLLNAFNQGVIDNLKELGVPQFITQLILKNGVLYLYDKKDTQKAMMAYYQSQINNILAPYSQQTIPIKLVNLDMSNLTWPYEYNVIGKLLLSTSQPHFTNIENNTKHIPNTIISLLQCKIALIVYYKAHQQYPETLEALIPQYLSTMPLDYYNGQSLHYDAASKTLYSQFINSKDLTDGLKEQLSLSLPSP